MFEPLPNQGNKATASSAITIDVVQVLFLARATVGTSLYVPLFQSVSQLVSQSASAIPFFKIHISVLLDHVGRRNFAWKLYVLVSIHPTTREAWQHFYLRI